MATGSVIQTLLLEVQGGYGYRIGHSNTFEIQGVYGYRVGHSNTSVDNPGYSNTVKFCYQHQKFF